MALLVASTTSMLAGGPSEDPLVEETEIDYQGRSYPALVVEANIAEEALKADWQDYVQDAYDVRLDGYGLFTNRDVLEAEGETFVPLSSKRADFYTRFSTTELGLTRMEVFMTLGYDVVVGPESFTQVYDELEGDVKAFIHQQLTQDFEARRATVADAIEDLERDQMRDRRKMERLERKVDRLTRNIEDNLKENEKLSARRDGVRVSLSALEAEHINREAQLRMYHESLEELEANLDALRQNPPQQ